MPAGVAFGPLIIARQKRFDNPRDASTVCRELRSLCPRNAKVINIESPGTTVSLAWCCLNLAFRNRGLHNPVL